jgi:hypothetical protein|tara:strand:+ start:267 stop:476 length:210 start_codon:yes stop_codon:yes gene_type:complete
MTNEKQLFTDLDLNPVRNINETYQDYILRRKKTNFILKKYKQVGRELFQQLFPEGVSIESMDAIIKEQN